MKSEIKKNLFPLVLIVKKELKKQNINYWVDMGSLLGIIRDKKLLEWDHDFDFSIFSEDRGKVIDVITSLREKGLIIKIEKNFPWFEDIVQIYDSSSNNDLHVDIGVYTKIGDLAFMRRAYAAYGKHSIILLDMFRKINSINVKREVSSNNIIISCGLYLYRITFALIKKVFPSKIKKILSKYFWMLYLDYGECKSFSVPLFFFERFTTVELYGEEFVAPYDYNKYLEFWYSKNWTTPQRDWKILDAKGCFVTKVNKYDKHIDNIEISLNE